MEYNRNSPYVKFAIAYCNKFGHFTINSDTKKREYFKDKLEEAFFIKHEYDFRNRKG